MKLLGRLAVVAVAASIVAACDKKPEGQAVAVVNGEEISLPELNAELTAANVPATADKKAVTGQLLQRMVDRRLMAQAAEEQGLDRTPQFISQERRLREELLIRLLGERQAAAIKAPSQQAVDKFIAENPAMFQQRVRYSLDQLVFDRPADMTLLRSLEQDHSLAALEQRLTSLGIAFTRNKAGLDTATVPPQTLKQIQALPPGEPFIIPFQDRIVASVITGQEAVGTSAEQNRQAAAELMRRRQLSETLQKQLEAERKEAKIEYQPGYAPKQTKTGQPAGEAKK